MCFGVARPELAAGSSPGSGPSTAAGSSLAEPFLVDVAVVRRAPMVLAGSSGMLALSLTASHPHEPHHALPQVAAQAFWPGRRPGAGRAHHQPGIETDRVATHMPFGQEDWEDEHGEGARDGVELCGADAGAGRDVRAAARS